MTDWRLPGYVELGELGRGAQGRVVLARGETDGGLVAIKYLDPRGLADERALERFRSEARALAQVRDRHVVRLHGLVETAEGAALVMEAVHGASLRTLLDRYEPMSPESALAVLKGSLLGLAAAHAVGVIHRDYKPANVIVQPDGLSKLIDFGVAGLIGERFGGGTPAYMAPERWRGRPASPAADVYAATCVFFECVTGARPYPGTDRAELRRRHLEDPVPVEAVPEPLRPLLERGLAKEPAARPPGAAAFVAELERAASAAYGPDWEARGWGALGVATAAVLPLAAAALATGGAAGAATAAGTGTGAGAGAGAGAAGQGIAATTAAKVAITATTATVVATAGVGAYSVIAGEEPPAPTASPAPSLERVSLTTPALEQTITLPGRPALRIRDARYVQVSGLADRAVQERVNAALRAPLEEAVTGFRRYLIGEHPPGSAPQCAELGAEPRVRLGGPRLVSVLYRFTTRTCSVADEDPPGADAVTVDLSTGRALTVDDLFPDAASLDRLSDRLPPPDAARRECGYSPPLRPALFRPQRFDDGRTAAPQILFALTSTGLELQFQRSLPCPQGLVLTAPYDRIRDVIRPEILKKITLTPTPERS